MYLAILLHFIDNLVCILELLFIAPFLSLNQLLRLDVFSPLEPIKDPLVELIAPMQQAVCGFCVGFAKSSGEL